MAEARQAVLLGSRKLTRRASAEGFIIMTNDVTKDTIFATGKDSISVAVVYALARAAKKRMYKVRNAMYNALLPSSTLSWYFAFGSTLSLRHIFPDVAQEVDSWIPLLGRIDNEITRDGVATVFLASTSWVLGTYTSRWLLKALLSYKGYLYAPRGKRSITLLMWGACLKMVKGFGTPGTYSFQKSLPSLPVPSLSGTCERYLESARPLLDDAEYQRMERLAHDFQKNEGRNLQLILKLKSWWAHNYVSDWWEKFVYLRGRTPIMINSNYYCLDAHAYVPTTNQVARAANFINNLLDFKILLDREKLEPLQGNGVPLCMNQYYRIFGTTRKPGMEEDTIQHIHDSKHVAVVCKGHYYIFNLYDDKRRRLTTIDIEQQLQWIVDDAEKAEPNAASNKLAAMTATDRTTWAEFQQDFMSSGVNCASLEAVERAVFVVTLMEDSPDHPVVVNAESPVAHGIFHGNGHNIWFDKSFNVIVMKNGRLGINAEHSWADAPVMAHVMEWALAEEFTGLGYDAATGSNKRIPQSHRTTYKQPLRLRWSFPDEAVEMIDEAVETAQGIIQDLDMRVLKHAAFSKGFIKRCKLSPDAFFQMALQLAYYRDAGHFAQTYEASMTRLFRNGRTETVRPVSRQSCTFVRSMCDPQVSAEERVKNLQVACEKHVQHYRDAMSGKGIDRHLFCLYVAAVWQGIESEFLQEVLGVPWYLSTSQTPTQQTKLWDIKGNPDKVSAGGGFGPVTDNGYGVSYIISSDDLVFFHITSKRSSAETDSERFADNVFKALQDMRHALVATTPSLAEA